MASRASGDAISLSRMTETASSAYGLLAVTLRAGF